jgi:hypothetical protein
MAVGKFPLVSQESQRCSLPVVEVAVVDSMVVAVVPVDLLKHGPL